MSGISSRTSIATAGAIAVFLALFSLVSWLVVLSRELPQIDNLGDYRPIAATKFFSDDGELVARFAHERRTVVSLGEIPKTVIHAFLAAEDRHYYTHEGIDYLGILRAVIKNLRPKARLQGASTITQQTVKTLVVGAERSYIRKIKEALLSWQLERNLSKDEILHIYLNQIYFGSGAWGVEEAAQTYFGKSVRDLNLSESAFLAAIPKNPSRYPPTKAPAHAKRRQAYVLEQMVQAGWASIEQATSAKSEILPTKPEPHAYLNKLPHYVEQARREVILKYGEQALYRDGMTIYLGVDAGAQMAAQRSLTHGLEAVAARRNMRIKQKRVEVDKLDRALLLIRERCQTLLQNLDQRRQLIGGVKPGTRLCDLIGVTEEDLFAPTKLAKRAVVRLATNATRFHGLISAVDLATNQVTVELGAGIAVFTPQTMNDWTGLPRLGGSAKSDVNLSGVFKKGDLITVEVESIETAPQTRAPSIVLRPIAVPILEGALVAIDPDNGLVRAMVGGYRQRPGGLLRATQSLRLPGSAFKPIVYLSGIESQKITQASLCADSPVVIRDKWTGKAWKPENYEDGRYDGNIIFRQALLKSKNTCSVKLAQLLGPDAIIDTAKRLGIAAKLPQNLTLALGTGALSPLELTRAYATIAAQGLATKPQFIRKVVSRDGKTLFESDSSRTRVASAASTFVLTQMMQAVVSEGTGRRAATLNLDLAGKTGTTNGSRDAWFGGFSPGLAAVVWVGRDDNRKMPSATGSNTALPIWMDFVAAAHAEMPRRSFSPPDEVTLTTIDPSTGRAVSPGSGISMAFITGTEPTEASVELPSIFIEDAE